jgi:hypothetical protein
MHGAKNFDSYEWEQSISNEKLEGKNNRLLQEMEIFEKN